MNSLSSLACACQNKAVALAGWFGNLVRGIGQAIGSAIGGPIGAMVGGYIVDRANELLQGHSPNWNQVNVPVIGQVNMWGVASRNVNITNEDLDNIQEILQQEKYQEWIETKFLPWSKKYFKKINGSQDSKYLASNSYRKKINEVLINLNALRIYYKSQQQLVGYRGLGAVDVESAIHQAKTREELMMILIEGITKSYLKSLRDAFVLQKDMPTLNSYPFDVSKLNVDAPELLDWSGISAKMNIKLFGEAQGNIDKVTEPTIRTTTPKTTIRTTTPTTTATVEIEGPRFQENKEETQQMIEEEMNSSSIAKEERQNAGLKLFGFVAVSSAIYYWWQDKKSK